MSGQPVPDPWSGTQWRTTLRELLPAEAQLRVNDPAEPGVAFEATWSTRAGWWTIRHPWACFWIDVDGPGVRVTIRGGFGETMHKLVQLLRLFDAIPPGRP